MIFGVSMKPFRVLLLAAPLVAALLNPPASGAPPAALAVKGAGGAAGAGAAGQGSPALGGILNLLGAENASGGVDLGKLADKTEATRRATEGMLRDTKGLADLCAPARSNTIGEIQQLQSLLRPSEFPPPPSLPAFATTEPLSARVDELARLNKSRPAAGPAPVAAGAPASPRASTILRRTRDRAATEK